jgi:transcriptional regulator with GAF, ATPase, and Fis domain
VSTILIPASRTVRLSWNSATQPETLSPSDRALRSQLLANLRQSRGNIAAVARVMDRAPVQIRRWCRRLQIDPAYFRVRRAMQDA